MYAKLHFEQQPFITKITDWTTHFAELPKTFLNIHCLYNKIILTYIKNLNIMKKFFIATILAVAAVLPASAQVRSLDMKANLRSDFGLGIGVTFQLPRNFEFAPSLNYYFNDSNTLTIDGDFRYRFELPRNFSIYPILGPVFFHADDYNKLGVDIGLGFAYDINSHWAIGAEGKYQYVDDWDDAYLSFCASYKF